MIPSEKLTMLKQISGVDPDELPSDETLLAYLTLAEKEILSWIYRAYPSGIPEEECALPCEYDSIQIMAVIVGWNQSGAEGQTSHAENGISRQFAYSDMANYIHRNVPSKVYVL
jgi:hypothetical protein